MIPSQVKSAIFQLAILLLAVTASAGAQTAASGVPSASTGKSGLAADTSPSTKTDPFELQPGEDPENRLVSPFAKHIVADQKEFWTGPARFRTKDLKWILPGAGITAAFIAATVGGRSR